MYVQFASLFEITTDLRMHKLVLSTTVNHYSNDSLTYCHVPNKQEHCIFYLTDDDPDVW